jgi:hypothetical protein
VEAEVATRTAEVAATPAVAEVDIPVEVVTQVVAATPEVAITKARNVALQGFC